MLKSNLVGLLGLLLAAGAWKLFVFSGTGYYAPIFSPDGKDVYFVERQSRAVVLGAGWEFFTPPAKSYIHRDRFRLLKIPAKDGSEEVITDWGASPTEGQRLSVYRGRVFGIADAHLRWQSGKLEGEVDVQKSVVRIGGKWMAGTRTMTGYTEDSVRGEWEAIAVPGRETLPCAIVLHNAVTSELRVALETTTCRKLYPNGIKWSDVEPQSRRAEIIRLRAIREMHARLVAEARQRGIAEMEAILQANRGMQKLGLYPKTPQIIARPAKNPGNLPVFRISPSEWRAGLFPDLELAIQQMGEEVEKSMGTYVRMEGFDTSRRLNDLLAAPGNITFYVEREGKLYEIQLLR